MVPVRNAFIVQAVAACSSSSGAPGHGRHRPLLGLKHADVGCGGGLLCESMARLGAVSAGFDVASASLDAAAAHARADAELEAAGNTPTCVYMRLSDARSFHIYATRVWIGNRLHLLLVSTHARSLARTYAALR